METLSADDQLGRKCCRDCGVEKPLSDFEVYKGCKDGRRNQCKQCRKAVRSKINRKFYQANKHRWRGPTGSRAMWKKNNPERHNEWNREWRRRNPEKARAAGRAYKIRRARAGGSFTETEVQQLWKLQSGLCHWCHEPMDREFERDHRIPLSRGGNNDIANIVLCHPRCNMSKGSKMPWEYLEGRLL